MEGNASATAKHDFCCGQQAANCRTRPARIGIVHQVNLDYREGVLSSPPHSFLRFPRRPEPVERQFHFSTLTPSWTFAHDDDHCLGVVGWAWRIEAEAGCCAHRLFLTPNRRRAYAGNCARRDRTDLALPSPQCCARKVVGNFVIFLEPVRPSLPLPIGPRSATCARDGATRGFPGDPESVNIWRPWSTSGTIFPSRTISGAQKCFGMPSEATSIQCRFRLDQAAFAASVAGPKRPRTG